ncbi:glycosyltransferase [Actinomadura citrea]|uniref:GT2 family glycosyltransferase n=1 Tax=Actinomadura citrea TaxID=46158 RepID=A0A7Y9G6C5_9ACTN|nr:glycosyltransferase [Actinomadura citrea]NYE10812.1 GT2 family glycosyltransferase [Actinomadura citrea]GGT73810.1 glycosyl transferase [Actinomadura citrea]
MNGGPRGRGGPSVTAVVVTYNRRDLLDEALTALGAQTRPPDRIIVVDNASADGTAAMVAERFPGADLLALPRNIGGAGGFGAGMARGMGGGADLLWLLDDDTVPEPEALQALLDARRKAAAGEDGPPALVASRVVWTDGRDHPMNTPRPKPRATAAESRLARAAGCVPIRSASFVSALVDATAVRERGLPVADYFLWNDDFEFTTRLLRGRRGLLCPGSVVVHKTREFGGTDADPGDRFFYEVRNKIWLFTGSRGLAPPERALYAGSTARRWARTFAGSSDRAVLRRALVRGVRDGLFTRPRPTAAILRETGVLRETEVEVPPDGRGHGRDG